MTEKGSGADLSAKAALAGSGDVIRGEKSWTFLYLVAGFLVSFTGTVIQIAAPESGLIGAGAFVALGALILWCTLWSGPVQDCLLGWKARHEGAHR